jgi:hypothetical protein
LGLESSFLGATNLDSRLGQIDFECNLLAHEDVGISRLAEQRLEDVELGSGEGCSFSSLLPWIDS